MQSFLWRKLDDDLCILAAARDSKPLGLPMLWSGNFADVFTVLTVGSATNYLDVGAVTSAPARYYRVRLGP